MKFAVFSTLLACVGAPAFTFFFSKFFLGSHEVYST
jgi:hypothetical protein